jgi:FixJ family two-component response regulator
MVLILDDDPLLAIDMAMTVENAGIAEVFVAGTLTAAGKLDLTELDVAILDVNIGPQTSYDLARQLLNARIPIAFVSGSQRAAVPVDLSHVPFMSKPYSRSTLLGIMRQALAANARQSRH